MKQFFKLTIFTLIILLLPVLVRTEGLSSGTPISVFYSGDVYVLEHAPLLINDSYYFKAPEISKILGMNYYVDSKRKIIFIEYNNRSNIFTIDDQPNSPKYIGDQLYIPFTFLSDVYGLSVKTTENRSAIYILPDNRIDSSMFSVFRNISCNYSINLPSHVIIKFDEEEIIQDGAIVLEDKNKFYHAVISCEILDETSLIAMRSYLNDFNSSEEYIFDELVKYKKSYFRAMQEYYKNSFMFGANPPDFEEANMKIFSEYKDVLFGQEATVTLYNTIHSNKNASEETIHINIIVPIYPNKSIITIDFITDREKLNLTALKRMSELVKSIEVQGVPAEGNELQVFSDLTAVNAAKRGIYPDVSDVNIKYSALLNIQSGYRIIYPSSFIPYMQNSIIEPFDYKSFKISYNDYFSVSVEPAGRGEPVKNKIELIRLVLGDKVESLEHSKINLSGKSFERVKYKALVDGEPEYVDSFYTINDGKLYTLQLNSRFKEPHRNISEEFAKIAASLEFVNIDNQTVSSNYSFVKYVDYEMGYTVSYPNEWIFQKTDNEDVKKANIRNPNYSGPLNIAISEAGISSALSGNEILRLLILNSKEEIDTYLTGYGAPFLGRDNRLLKISIKEDKNALYLYRLINYLDSGDQNKLCYAIDIITDDNVYSMFISISHYLTFDGGLYDRRLGSTLKTITETFGLIDPESIIKNELVGESADRLIEAVKAYFKTSFRLEPEVKFPAYTDSSKKSVMVLVEGIPDSGYYEIATEYKNGQLQLLNRILKRDLLHEASLVLEKRYSEKYSKSIETDVNDMSLKIRYRDNSESPFIEKNYSVVVDRSNNSFNWKLERSDTSNTLKDYCEIYLENFLSKSVNIYFQKSDEDLSRSDYIIEGNDIIYVPLYTEFGFSSGYFVLEVDPLHEQIEAVSYTPLSSLSDKLKSVYSKAYPDFQIVNYAADDDDKFKINVFMLSQPSRTVSMFRMNQVRVIFDRDNSSLVLVDESGLFSFSQ